MQLAIESRGTEYQKMRRRAVLHGVRAGLWLAADKPTMDELRLALSQELFGEVGR
ncbi:hypothetical protein D3C78_1910340 [compost metagenome]